MRTSKNVHLVALQFETLDKFRHSSLNWARFTDHFNSPCIVVSKNVPASCIQLRYQHNDESK